MFRVRPVKDRGNCRSHKSTILASLDAHKLPVLGAFFLELHVTITLREQRVIAADANIQARMKTRAPLTNKNVARNDLLAAENLDAQAFGFGVTAVLTAAACFFMCHAVVPVVRAARVFYRTS